MTLTALALSITLGFPSVQIDLSTPKRTVISFCASVESQKWANAARCVVGGSATRAQAAFATMPKGTSWKLELKDLVSETRAEDATVTGDLFFKQLIPGRSPMETTYFEKLELQRRGSDWLIVGQKFESNASPTSVLGFVASLLAHGMPGSSPGTAQASPASTVTLSNLKQISIGMFIYASDYNDRLPRADWQKSIQPYLKNTKVMKSPMSTAAKPSPYTFNPALYGIKLAKIALPAKTALVYEGKGNVLAYHYGGKGAVAYVDGHVKLVTKAEAAKLKWKP